MEPHRRVAERPDVRVNGRGRSDVCDPLVRVHVQLPNEPAPPIGAGELDSAFLPWTT